MASIRATKYWRSFFGMKSGEQGSKYDEFGRGQSWTKNHYKNMPLNLRLTMSCAVVLVAMGVGISTASQHLIHSSGVNLSKKKRLTFPELDLSGDVMDSVTKKYGICRKLGQLNYNVIGEHSDASSPNSYQVPNMAFRTARYWRSVVEYENHVNRSMMRSFVSTAPKNASSASTAINNEAKQKNKWVTPEMVPLVGMMGIALALGIHTVYKNLVHAPAVKLTKTNRASISEADHPHEQTTSGGKFVTTSFLRKVGHLQDSSRY